MNKKELLELALGGLDELGDDMMPATGPRPLLLSEPDAGLIWLNLKGKDAGFEPDQKKYRFWPWLAKQGCEFETAYRKHECPKAVVLLEHDTDIRKKPRESIEKTIDHIRRGTLAMAKVGLSWQPAGVYGSADFVFHTSWLYKRYPQLRPEESEEPHYVIADAKLGLSLDSSSKKDQLEAIAVQLRIYSYILGNYQGYMPKKAYVISPDHIHDPIPIDVNLELGQPLPEELCDLREDFRYIKQQEKREFVKQKDKLLQLNPASKDNGDWHAVKHQIIEEHLKPRPLVMLPGVGSKIAARMKLQGYKSVDDLLALTVDGIERLSLETIEGIDRAKAERIKAVLKANRTGHASNVPMDLMPVRSNCEYFIDVEYFNSMHVDYLAQWPDFTGVAMIYMIGVGWREGGEFKFRRFTAEAESYEAEEKMLRQFIRFLRENGVFDPARSCTLFSFSAAERTQMRKAAERYGLKRLGELEDKWFDALEVFHDGPIAIPGMWSFSLKDISSALGEYAERYSVEYGDEIGEGGGAMVAAWAGYETEEPLKSEELKLVGEYLKNDVLALCNTVMWLRAVCRQQTGTASRKSFSWYAMCRSAKTEVKQTRRAGLWYRPELWRPGGDGCRI